MVHFNLLLATVAASLLCLSRAAPSSNKPIARDVDFPAPTCTTPVDVGFNVDWAFEDIGYYCSDWNTTVGQNGQPAVGKFESSTSSDHQYQMIFKLSHDDGDSTCADAAPAPNQNDGRDCNTIFHDIVNQCRCRVFGHLRT